MGRERLCPAGQEELPRCWCQPVGCSPLGSTGGALAMPREMWQHFLTSLQGWVQDWAEQGRAESSWGIGVGDESVGRGLHTGRGAGSIVGRTIPIVPSRLWRVGQGARSVVRGQHGGCVPTVSPRTLPQQGRLEPATPWK